MTYLFVAYAITWVMILGYVVSLARRRRQALREAESLTRALERRQQPKS
ncbi:MAG: CcmD family protein [Anaerolineae bacterium]